MSVTVRNLELMMTDAFSLSSTHRNSRRCMINTTRKDLKFYAFHRMNSAGRKSRRMRFKSLWMKSLGFEGR